MKHFNKLKDKIRQEKAELPEGFGWEEMQDGIFDKMDINTTSPKFSFNFFNKFFFLGASLFIGIAIIFVLSNQNDQQTNSTLSSNAIIDNRVAQTDEIKSGKTDIEIVINPNSENNIHQIQDRRNQTSQLTDPSTKENYGETTKQNRLTNAEKLKQEGSSLRSGIATKRIKQAKEKSAIPAGKIQNIREHILDKKIPTDVVNPSLEQYPSLTKKTAQPEYGYRSTVKADSKPHEMKNRKSLQNHTLKSISYLPLSDASIPTKQAFITLPSPEKHTPKLIQPLKRNLWSFELGGGWNTWSYGLSNSSTEGLHAKNIGDYGFSFNSRLSRKFNEKLSLTTGIDIDIMYKKLNVSYSELTEREVEDVVLSYVTNSISGTTKAIIGDTTVVDTTIYTVNNYNKYQVISLPLIFNYTVLKKANWSLDIGMGPSISFLTNYQGKYLEDNELKSFDSSSNLYSTTPKLALHANLQLKRKLVYDFYLGFRIDFKNHLNNWARESENTLKPKIVSGSIVVGKAF